MMEKAKELFDTNVYLVICDASITIFKDHNVSDYNAFCEYMRLVAQSSNVKLINSYILDIYDYVNQIFAMPMTDMVYYIYDFFIEKKWLEYKESISLIREVFGCYTRLNK